jgi:hypothetical protein
MESQMAEVAVLADSEPVQDCPLLQALLIRLLLVPEAQAQVRMWLVQAEKILYSVASHLLAVGAVVLYKPAPTGVLAVAVLQESHRLVTQGDQVIPHQLHLLREIMELLD